jgi:hypothetical protein
MRLKLIAFGMFSSLLGGSCLMIHVSKIVVIFITKNRDKNHFPYQMILLRVDRGGLDILVFPDSGRN